MESVNELNLLLDKQTIEILKYIRNSQAHDTLITKEAIAKHMDEKAICSRPTTLKIIQRLLDNEIIKNDKKKDNTFSRLIINPEIDWRVIEMGLLTTYIKEVQARFADLWEDTGLTNELLKTISRYNDKKQTRTLREEPKPIRYSKK